MPHFPWAVMPSFPGGVAQLCSHEEQREGTSHLCRLTHAVTQQPRSDPPVLGGSDCLRSWVVWIPSFLSCSDPEGTVSCRFTVSGYFVAWEQGRWLFGQGPCPRLPRRGTLKTWTGNGSRREPQCYVNTCQVMGTEKSESREPADRKAGMGAWGVEVTRGGGIQVTGRQGIEAMRG